ncbi:MAG: phosphotransferase [Geminicoccaceae bacterium]
MSRPATEPLLRALADPAERLLARSILGTDDPAVIAARVDAHCRSALGAGVVSVDFAEISTGAAFGLSLTDERRVFFKAWTPATSTALLRDSHEVQSFLAARGFPCPAVLAGPRPFGAGHAAIHEYRHEGDIGNARSPPLRAAMASALARLIAMAAPLRHLPDLRRPPPPDAVWPPPHNALFDFEATRQGAEWIEAIAVASREILLASAGPRVVGHWDWSARNLRFRGEEVCIVYDWDSAGVDLETAFVGKTAIAFPMTWYGDEPEPFPSPEAAAAFVRDYETARGRPFTAAERREIVAAATYALSYTARCSHAIDPPGAVEAGSAGALLKLHAAGALADLLEHG